MFEWPRTVLLSVLSFLLIHVTKPQPTFQKHTQQPGTYDITLPKITGVYVLTQIKLSVECSCEHEYCTFTLLPLLGYDLTHTGSTGHKFLTFVKFLYRLLDVGSVSCHVCVIVTSCADLAYKLCGIGISV